MRVNLLRVAAAVMLSALSAFAGGPGLGNLTYTSNELFSTIATFTTANSAPRGHGFTPMHKGYLVVIFADDGGGGNGSGGFTFYNVSNPRLPLVTFTTYNNPAYSTAGGANYAGDLREAHAQSFWGNYVCLPANKSGGSGLQFWDWSNIDPPNPSPQKIGSIVLPGLTGGDYTPTPWWVFWQAGRYVYVGGTAGGLYIVDATDPANPVLVDRGNGLPNPIPTSQTGGFRLNTMFAVGNLLVSSASDASGLSTFDISNPVNPVLLDTISTDSGLYSIMVNGNRILGAHDPAWIWDISDPANISFIGAGPNVADKGGYGAFQDGIFHYGSSSCYVKLNITSFPFTVIGTNAPTGFVTPDWDFASPLGNLIFQGNDHSGSALVVHQIWPDTNGPLVNMVVPRNNATNQALTSRVGLTFTDQIDLRSVNTNTCIIRPLGGSALAGRYSHQTGIINFWPDQTLQPNTTYEVVVPIGGIRDLVSNATSLSFTSRFTTVNITLPLTIAAQAAPPATNSQTVNFSASASGAGPMQFSWNFGDGSPPTSYSTGSNASHAFALPGHYSVRVTVTNGTSQASASFVQTIYRPLTAIQPTASGTILIDTASNRVWNVNSDSDTVTAIHASNFTKQFEKPVGKHPRTIAQAPDGSLWVVNQDDATISVLNRADGNLLQTINLPRASRPFGIAFSPDGNAAYVTLQGTGRLLRLNPATRTITGDISIGPSPRGIAVSGDSQRVLITRFLSSDANGEVVEVGASTFAITRTFALALSPGPDAEDNGRGLPNYLTSITISPDGQRAWIPSKKDNIQRGSYRDGQALTFESTVRTIVSQIDLMTNAEDLSARIDLNDRDMAYAARFSPLGDYLFVAVQGANSIDVFDAYSRSLVTAIETTGLAPQGLAISPDGRRLYVQNFMSRTVKIYDIGGIVASTNNLAPTLATNSVVTNELLALQVLFGKQIFYNAEDTRMNRDSYLSCASCHLDGGDDGRIWDFTNRGEGLRNTITLIGRSGMGHGRVHWSANFDEIQDFEHDIRGPFGGSGFMSDGLFNSGTRNTPLGDRKAGLSPELDALAAYVSSLTNVNPSPLRASDGSLTPDGVAGKSIFASLNCASCHTGNQFTDSSADILHDVGTIKPSSGQRLGQPLTGIDTPSLKGIWETPPYFHDGSAATLTNVFDSTNGLHGTATASLTPTQKQQLIAYLLQIDDSEIVNLRPTVSLLSPTNGTTLPEPATLNLSASASDSDGIRRVEFFADGIFVGQATNGFNFTWTNVPPGIHQLTARATDNLGDFTTTPPVTLTVTPTTPLLRWTSAIDNVWDITNTANWFNLVYNQNDTFDQGANVLFDDSPGVATSVTIGSGIVAPAVITNSSSVNQFTINGAGGIGGAAAIVKNGVSTLMLSTSNNFTGDVLVQAGTLKVDNNSALGTVGKTVVSSGATLDVGGPSFAVNAANIISEVIYVSGTGVGGQGAIINSGSVAQHNALHNVVLTGDTTFGGSGNAGSGGDTPGRWDIRDTGGPASLITSNQPYNLTKDGPNYVNLVNTTVDPALANIEVRQGILGVQGSTTLGNPTNTLTIFSNALLHLTSFTVVPNKVVVLRDGGFVDSTSANNTFGGPFTLQGSNSFLITANSLTLTNVLSGPGSLYKLGGSTLILRAANTYLGATIVSAGTLMLTNIGSISGCSNITVAAGATLNVQPRTDSTLTLSSNQTLGGNGTILGSVTVSPGAQLSPGTSIGALTITNSALLRGATVIELNKTAATNDVLRGLANISYGGTLRLINLGSALLAGDAFKIFYATSYSGTFTNCSPAIPAVNLAWNTNTLATDGTLRIVSAPTPQPRIASVSVSGGNLRLSGTNGVPGWPYYLLASTNVASPLATWTRIATNQFDTAGAFAVTNSVNPALPRQFYVIQLQ